MDYEKAYKEALERAKVFTNNDKDNNLMIRAKGTMEYLFPELSESEDEKTRKKLIDRFKSLKPNSSWYEIPIDNILSWLEKQKNLLSDNDKDILRDAIYFINEFQKSDRCKNENDMQNSVTCENLLKRLVEGGTEE